MKKWKVTIAVIITLRIQVYVNDSQILSKAKKNRASVNRFQGTIYKKPNIEIAFLF